MVQKMRSNDISSTGSMGISGIHDLESYNSKSPSASPPVPFDAVSYTRIIQSLAKLYPYDPAAVAASISNLTQPHLPASLLAVPSNSLISPPPLISISQSLQDTFDDEDDANYSPKALDLSTQSSNNVVKRVVSYKRISLDKVKPKIVEDIWVENDVKLAWTESRIAAFNPAQKLFMCLDCEHVGFLSRVAEHWLGSHANLRVFHCPRCPYTSAWSRCVKMHLTRQHNEQFADTTMWKGNATLLEVTRLMQELRTKVETRIDSSNLLADKRFYCPHCPYATDRRDLFTRHENIHKEDKPFHCYLCLKQFNRADHVKKHFVRMHADAAYDMSKIRKAQNTNKLESNDSNETFPLHLSTKCLNPTLSSSVNIKTDTSKSNDVVSGSVSPVHSLTLVRIDPVKTKTVNQSSNSTRSISPGSKSRRRGDKAFTCHYCNWSGSDNWCLKRHMNTHIKPFACVMCDYKAARAERLSTHVLKVHNKRICNKCNFLSDTPEELHEHTREEHHNNPYSRRHICATCGMSFDTKANLETHTHLTHTRPQSPADLVQITPILFPETGTPLPQNLSLTPLKNEETKSSVCPIKECSKPIDNGLPDHLQQFHGSNFEARCPHCQYQLTRDEISKEHWLTHHEDVCGACVHIFTSVYGPQLWKKVNGKSSSSDSSLDNIVTGLNRKRPLEDDCSDSQTSPGTPPTDSLDSESDRCTKRPRKQSYPKKVISVAEAESLNTFVEPPPIVPKSPKKKRVCLKCPDKPKFSSVGQWKLHRFRRHRISGQSSNKLKLSS